MFAGGGGKNYSYATAGSQLNQTHETKTMNRTETAELIEMPFGARTCLSVCLSVERLHLLTVDLSYHNLVSLCAAPVSARQSVSHHSIPWNLGHSPPTSPDT